METFRQWASCKLREWADRIEPYHELPPFPFKWGTTVFTDMENIDDAMQLVEAHEGDVIFVNPGLNGPPQP